MANALILNGSPRRQGDVAHLLGELLRQLPGWNMDEVRSYDGRISPCLDCRACWEKPGCVIQDEMQRVYTLIDQADWILLASPVHFEELSGSLLALLSRLQPYWMARRRGEELLSPKVRRGALLLCAGGPGPAKEAKALGQRLLHCMGAEEVLQVHCKNCDSLPVLENAAALEEVRLLAARMRQSVENAL